MPPREWRLRIEDILEAAGRIARYVEGMDLSAFAPSRGGEGALRRSLRARFPAEGRLSRWTAAAQGMISFCSWSCDLYGDQWVCYSDVVMDVGSRLVPQVPCAWAP